MTEPVRVRAVLFDLDGVLADSADSIERAWCRWAAGYGLDPAEILPHVPGRLAVDTIRTVRPDLSGAVVRADADRVNAYQVTDQADRTAVPGMVAVVRALGDRPWAVVTAAPRELAAARLARCGYPPAPVLVGAEDVTAGKPDPAGYRTAAARLGVPPGETLVVEDSAAGIRAGLAAGAAVLALNAPSADGATLRARDGHDVRITLTADAIEVALR
jgi:mannitol-1-/sugar-/sorbitol-6-phosphatase